jgi:invasion protein IalB
MGKAGSILQRLLYANFSSWSKGSAEMKNRPEREYFGFAGLAVLAVLAAASLFGSSDAGAQQAPTQDRTAPRTQPVPAPAPNPQTTPAAPQRTETIVYDSWIVTCRDSVATTSKKTCSARLEVREQKSRRILVSWMVGRNAQGVLTANLQTPSGGIAFGGGRQLNAVQIQKGMELKLGDAQVRKLAFVACAPGVCQASAPLDDAFIREIMAAADAAVTIYNQGGQAINFKIPHKGFDKAIAAIGR